MPTNPPTHSALASFAVHLHRCTGSGGSVACESPLLQLNPHTCFVCADAWNSRWVESKHKSDYGKFVLTAGKFYGDVEKDKGECGVEG